MSDVILYIETNFLISHALGRDPSTDEILFGSLVGVRVTIPSVCIIEAFSTFEVERRGHNRLISELKRQTNQSKRNAVSPRTRLLADHLEQSVIELGEIFNDSTGRLLAAVEAVRTSAVFIDLNPIVLGASLDQPLIDDPTDSIILGSILNHARLDRTSEKIFVSENRRDFDQRAFPKAALQGAGIKYLEQASQFLEWRRSRAES